VSSNLKIKMPTIVLRRIPFDDMKVDLHTGQADYIIAAIIRMSTAKNSKFMPKPPSIQTTEAFGVDRKP